VFPGISVPGFRITPPRGSRATREALLNPIASIAGDPSAPRLRRPRLKPGVYLKARAFGMTPGFGDGAGFGFTPRLSALRAKIPTSAQKPAEVGHPSITFCFE
jgi:hypothetical protein